MCSGHYAQREWVLKRFYCAFYTIKNIKSLLKNSQFVYFAQIKMFLLGYFCTNCLLTEHTFSWELKEHVFVVQNDENVFEGLTSKPKDDRIIITNK